MAANTTPIFIDTDRHQSAELTSGASSLQTLFDAGADGSRVDSATFVATGVTTVARWQITINDGNTNERVIKDGIIEVVDDTSALAAWQLTVPLDVFLEADDTMNVRLDATHNACSSGIDVSAVGGDF
jgi:hypothetical protein